VANAKEPSHEHPHTRAQQKLLSKVFGAFGIKAKPSGLNGICAGKGLCLKAILLPERIYSHREYSSTSAGMLVICQHLLRCFQSPQVVLGLRSISKNEH